MVGPTIFGHNGAASAISVGAVPYDRGESPERYSSRGPVTHYFGPVESRSAPAPALTSPQTISKPDVVASDCVATTFFAEEEGSAWRFCGTSAAAPHCGRRRRSDAPVESLAFARGDSFGSYLDRPAGGRFRSGGGWRRARRRPQRGCRCGAPADRLDHIPSQAGQSQSPPEHRVLCESTGLLRLLHRRRRATAVHVAVYPAKSACRRQTRFRRERCRFRRTGRHERNGDIRRRYVAAAHLLPSPTPKADRGS